MTICAYFRGRFALETLAVWAVLCLPINLLTCYMVTVAPDYDHHEAQQQEGNFTEAAEGGGGTRWLADRQACKLKGCNE